MLLLLRGLKLMTASITIMEVVDWETGEIARRTHTYTHTHLLRHIIQDKRRNTTQSQYLSLQSPVLF